MVEIRQVNRRDWLILQTSRVFGHLFALTLFGVVALAMIPNQFFIVSTRAVVNAPVQIIPSPIYGRVSEIDLQVGQVVDRGEVRASMSNPNQDQTSLTGLRLERLDLTERLRNRVGDLARRKDQLQALINQIDTVKAGIVSEQEAVVENAEATVKSFQAKVAEQDALLLQKVSLAKKGIISKQSLDPLRQKRDAAVFELDAAALDLKRQRIVHELVQQGTYTGGSIGTSLMTLEQQRKGLAGSIGEDEAAIGQMQDRSKELDSLIALEEKRVGGAESAQVVIQQRGQIVSVHASQGDFLSQGQPLARSLDCTQSFVAAVYAGRDVADLAIDTPAMVNLVSLGQKRSAHVWKIVRYFSSGVESRYFASLPKADGHEVYVFLKLDEDVPASGDQSSDDRFFGCHAGEDVVVSIGEPVIDKLARYYDVATTSLLSSLAPDATASQPAKIQVGPVAGNDGLSTN